MYGTMVSVVGIGPTLTHHRRCSMVLSSRQKMVIIFVIMVCFMLFACDGANTTWGCHDSGDVTGVIWRALP
jgi:predicted small secreted protein